MEVHEVRCDAAMCAAQLRPQDPRDGWMALAIMEFGERPYTRKADLCPVHAQTFLDFCGPLPRSTYIGGNGKP